MFTFSHRSQETWRDARLVSLKSETIEHGETLHVDGAATPQGFCVVSKGGAFIGPAATLTSNSLRTPAVPEQAAVFEHFADFRRLHPSLSTLNIKHVAPSEAVIPIHPGALNHYREASLIVR